jgi:hypothetical protein
MNRQVAVWREQGERVGVFAQGDSTAILHRFPGAGTLSHRVLRLFISSVAHTRAENHRKRFLVSPGTYGHGLLLLMGSAWGKLGQPLGDPGKVIQKQQ